MYRILEQNQEVRERRDQLRHPNYAKPELVATAPNQLWGWEITKLLGPTKWTYYYLCVIIDVFRSLRPGLVAGRLRVGHPGRTTGANYGDCEHQLRLIVKA